MQDNCVGQTGTHGPPHRSRASAPMRWYDPCRGQRAATRSWRAPGRGRARTAAPRSGTWQAEARRPAVGRPRATARRTAARPEGRTHVPRRRSHEPCAPQPPAQPPPPPSAPAAAPPPAPPAPPPPHRGRRGACVDGRLEAPDVPQRRSTSAGAAAAASAVELHRRPPSSQGRLIPMAAWPMRRSGCGTGGRARGPRAGRVEAEPPERAVDGRLLRRRRAQPHAAEEQRAARRAAAWARAASG